MPLRRMHRRVRHTPSPPVYLRVWGVVLRASPLMEKIECPHRACQPSALHVLARGRAGGGALVVLHLCVGALVICTAFTNVEYCTSCSKCVCWGPCRSSFMHVLHFTDTLVELPYVGSVNCIDVCLKMYTDYIFLDISILIFIFI